jgi:hypothetical protein
MHIKLTQLCSVSDGEGLSASRLAGKCGQLSVAGLLRLRQSRGSFYAEQTHGTAHADFVVAPGDLKSP